MEYCLTPIVASLEIKLLGQRGLRTNRRLSSSGSAAAGFGSLWLGLLVQLPVLGWLYRTSYDEMRTDEERRLWRSFDLGVLLGLLLFCVPAMAFVDDNKVEKVGRVFAKIERSRFGSE